jgi:hypothetical protein
MRLPDRGGHGLPRRHTVRRGGTPVAAPGQSRGNYRIVAYGAKPCLVVPDQHLTILFGYHLVGELPQYLQC